MADDGFHEIQLSGKQLVFLFMTTTAVLVVIFLCGVLVGRGVRAERPVDFAALATEPVVDAAPATPSPEPPSEPPPAANESAPATPPAADELSYYKRLEAQEAPPENLKPARPSAPVATPVEPPAAQPAPAPAETTSPTTAAPVGPADGWAIQVAALRERGEAQSIVRRLAGKGYPAYVVEPAPGAPASVFRVRVGKYKDRREAEQIVRRLEREEQFKPWITR